MSKATKQVQNKAAIVAVFVVIVAAITGAGVYEQNKNSGHVQTVTNSQQHLSQISYDGKKGVSAYTLLQKYATVTAKHYSFGYFVTSINGTAGNGPKYWTLFVNGKESQVGASAYITKNSDKITWKLQ